MNHPIGTVTRIGNDANGQPCFMISTTREELARADTVIFSRVAVVPLDAIREYEVVGFDAALKTVELRFANTPDVALGDVWSVVCERKP